MNISKRLNAVATLVDVGVRVIDVGCDHAYLDIYLTLNNSNKCVATDINENALNGAKYNIEKYNLKDKIETKLTNGLNNIKVNKKDTIVISGMGTHTILNILNSNNLSDTLIISSNNDVELLRREIIKLGYIIDTEIFLIDKGKPYIIIKFKKGTKKYKEIDYKLGPILKNNVQYQEYLIKKYKKVLNNISRKKILLRINYRIQIFKIKYLTKINLF